MQIKIHDASTGETVIREATAAEVASITTPQPVPNPRLVADEQEAATVKADTQVQQFLDMTPAQLDGWITANITNEANLAVFRVNVATALRTLGQMAQAAARGRRLRN